MPFSKEVEVMFELAYEKHLIETLERGLNQECCSNISNIWLFIIG